MIYFTTFILTLILSHIAHATPACGDVAPPEELYDPTYADDQYRDALPSPFHEVVWSSFYDNLNGNTAQVACSVSLAPLFPHFKDFLFFPFIGGAWNVKPDASSCGSCWNLTNGRADVSIRVTVINSVPNGGPFNDYFNISREAFNILNGGKPGTFLQVLAHEVTPYPCGLL